MHIMLKTTQKPYYKIQYFSTVSLSWVDIQMAFATFMEAMDAPIIERYNRDGVKFRVMEISSNSRKPVTQ